jgi:hypothetical protein
MKIALNTKHVGKMPAPTPGGWWNRYNGDFGNFDISIRELAAHIQQGHGMTTQHRGYRKADKFIAGQHIALDFDDLPAGTTLQSFANDDPFITNHAAMLHTTSSHTPDEPRIRVIFELDRPIANKDKYALLASSLLDCYGHADKSCKDACRLFFGAPGCDLLLLGNVLTLELCAEYLVQPCLAKQDRKAKQMARQVIASRPPDQTENSDLDMRRDKLLANITNAPEGEKYHTLLRVSRAFGGYVAGGYYVQNDVRSALRAAIAARDINDVTVAYQGIDDALAFGMQSPLYFAR